MKKIMITMLTLLLFTSLVSAASIGPFEFNKNVELYQTCDDCTYCNFTSIKYPNSTAILRNIAATRDNSYYYYTLDKSNISVLGEYTYCYECGDGTDTATGCIDFEVTTDGRDSSLSTGLAIILCTIILVLFGIGMYIYSRNEDKE